MPWTVEIRTGDMFEVDLSKVDVLVLYQPPKLLERMKPQLAQLRPGSRIVSHFFLIPGIEPDETRTLAEERQDPESHSALPVGATPALGRTPAVHLRGRSLTARL